MAHYCVSNNVEKYNKLAYMIRSRTFKGLSEGKMQIHSLFDDEKIKLEFGMCCVYCGSKENISIDHIFPRHFGGSDMSDNLVCACRKCNSSKNHKDMMLWYAERNEFPPLMLLRRYLKLVYAYCVSADIMNSSIEEIDDTTFPFNFTNIPISYPQPCDLKLSSH